MGRASANGLRVSSDHRCRGLAHRGTGRGGRRQEEGRKRQARRAHYAAAPGGRRRCDQREGEGQGRPSRRRRRPGHRLRSAHLGEEGEARQAHRQRAALGRGHVSDGRVLGDRAERPVRQGRQEEGQEERGQELACDTPRSRRGGLQCRIGEPDRAAVPRPVDRHLQREPLRLHGSHGLPAAVAERLLHQGGPDDRHGAPARHQHELDAGQHPRRSTSTPPTSTGPTASARAT